MDCPVNLGRIRLGATLAARRAADIDQNRDALADFRREAFGADRLLARHETAPARLLHLRRNLAPPEVIGVADPQHVPAIALKAGRDVLGKG